MNGLAENPLSTASQTLLQYVYLHFNPNDDDAAFLASNNLALPRQRFIEMNGFDTRFPLAAAEDRELCDRWRWLQRRIVYVPEAAIQPAARRDWRQRLGRPARLPSSGRTGEALRRIGDPSYRVALVASNIQGDTDRDHIRSMLDAYGVASQIAVFEDLDPAGVNRILNQSKVNLLLSRQEGSNRSLFEGFFAGVPGLAFSNHAGIPKTHFTGATGRLIAEPELAGALLYFRDHWSAFDPRPWALANIAPEVTTSKLNLVLRRLAQERREPWTRDITAKCNRPDLHYYPDESAAPGFPTMEELLARFPTPLTGSQGKLFG